MPLTEPTFTGTLVEMTHGSVSRHITAGFPSSRSGGTWLRNPTWDISVPSHSAETGASLLASKWFSNHQSRQTTNTCPPFACICCHIPPHSLAWVPTCVVPNVCCTEWKWVKSKGGGTDSSPLVDGHSQDVIVWEHESYGKGHNQPSDPRTWPSESFQQSMLSATGRWSEGTKHSYFHKHWKAQI